MEDGITLDLFLEYRYFSAEALRVHADVKVSYFNFLYKACI